MISHSVNWHSKIATSTNNYLFNNATTTTTTNYMHEHTNHTPDTTRTQHEQTREARDDGKRTALTTTSTTSRKKTANKCSSNTFQQECDMPCSSSAGADPLHSKWHELAQEQLPNNLVHDASTSSNREGLTALALWPTSKRTES